MRSKSLKSVLFLNLIGGMFLSGCPNDAKVDDSKKRKDQSQETAPVSSNKAIMTVSVTVDPMTGYGKLRLADVPNDASLICGLDEERLPGCANNFEFPLPDDHGAHKLSVIAKVKGQIRAVGETKFYVGEASSEHSGFNGPVNPEAQYSSDLTLELDPDFRVNGRKFQNGTWIKKNDTTTFRFRFKHTPRCNPEVRCISDQLQSGFKPLCDSTNTKTYRASTMARGLQYFRIEASCGDAVGKPLLMYWYGVPDNYQYMGLQGSSVYNEKKKQRRYIFNLMKANDCPENKLSFRCRETKNGTFAPCTSNSVDNPDPGFAIMPVCNGIQYPPYFVE